MEVLGIRYCQVGGDTEAFARFLRDGLGVAERDLGQSSSEFTGAIFHAGDSRIELWPESDGMPATVMLQLVVDDADVFAATARENGLEPRAPSMQTANGSFTLPRLAACR